MTQIADMPRRNFAVANEDETTFLPAVIRRTAWGAVAAAAASAIGLQIIFSVLGVAIGMGAASTEVDAESIGIAAGIWWLVTGTLALLAGGLILGRILGIVRSWDVLLHAFTMWAVTAIVGFLFVWSSASMAAHSGASAMSPIGMYSVPTSYATSDDMRGTSTDVNARSDMDTRTATTAELEEARDAAQTASWWTLFALVLGVSASILGAWWSAPQRIAVRRPIDG